MQIVILGAGAIGCFVGAHWAAAGAQVTLIGRESLFSGFRDVDLHLTGDQAVRVEASQLTLSSDPAALESADLAVLAMKATGLERALKDIQAHCPTSAPLVCLLNGLRPVRDLRAALPEHQIIAGMVPFNVVWRDPAHLHKSSAGRLALQRSPSTAALADLVEGSGAEIDLFDNLAPVQHGKLLLNLINPINALSGLPLHDMLSNRAYRRIYGDVVQEALAVYAATDTPWVKVGPISPNMAARLLTLPNWIFNPTLLKIQKIDRTSMTSMASDLMAGKATEIDVLNGEIVRLAESANRQAPLNAALVRLVRQAETEGPPNLSADALRRELGL